MTEITSFWNRVEMALLNSDMKSIKDLCVRIGTPYQTMINQRAVDRYPSVETLTRMARELGVSIDWLVSGRTEYLSLSDEKKLKAVQILLSM